MYMQKVMNYIMYIRCARSEHERKENKMRASINAKSLPFNKGRVASTG
jgi:hypothetical protein